MKCSLFFRCKIIPQGIRLAWNHSLTSLWPLKIPDWYIYLNMIYDQIFNNLLYKKLVNKNFVYL